MKKDIKRIKSLIDKYVEKLNLHNKRLDVYLSDNTHIIKERDKKCDILASDYCAEIMNRDIFREQYSMSIDKNAIDDDLDDTVCHELLHVLFWDMTDLLETCIEITNLTRVGKATLYQTYIQREHDIIERLLKVLK